MAKRITWGQAAEIIGVSDRQMRRWCERYRELRPEVIEYALSRFEAELTKAVKNVTGQMTALDMKRRKIEKELKYYMVAIASGVDAVSIRNGITDRERQLHAINAQIVSAQPDSVRAKIQHARRFVTDGLKDIKKLFGTDSARR
jgi:hypothetical protein